jgi:hypothetical protein
MAFQRNRFFPAAWKFLAALIITILLIPGSGFAWGRLAHHLTAGMAEARLTTTALAAAQRQQSALSRVFSIRLYRVATLRYEKRA